MKILLYVFALSLCVPFAHAHDTSWSATFNTSAYLPNCTGTFRTATGKYADAAKRYIAVDRRVIPMHSKVCVENMGCYTAEDTGGAIKGHKLDILMATKSQALQWGRRNVKATVYPYHQHKD